MTKSKKIKDNAKQILDRIARIKGQLNGIERMVKEKKECLNIIMQITAIREAATMLGVELLKNDFICKQKIKPGVSEKYFKTLFKLK